MELLLVLFITTLIAFSEASQEREVKRAIKEQVAHNGQMLQSRIRDRKLKQG